MSPQFTEFQEKRAKRTAPWKKRHLPARLRKAGDKLSLVLYPGAVPPGRLPRRPSEPPSRPVQTPSTLSQARAARRRTLSGGPFRPGL